MGCNLANCSWAERQRIDRQGFAAVRKKRASEKLESEPASIHTWDRKEASVPIERLAVTVEAGPSKCDSQDWFRVVIMDHREQKTVRCGK